MSPVSLSVSYSSSSADVLVASVVVVVLFVVLALNTGLSEDSEVPSGETIALILVTLFFTGAAAFDVIFNGSRLHLSPRNPAGHSQEKYPSSLINEVHLPPFSQVPGLFSQ